jgi:hypothetical protein
MPASVDQINTEGFLTKIIHERDMMILEMHQNILGLQKELEKMREQIRINEKPTVTDIKGEVLEVISEEIK